MKFKLEIELGNDAMCTSRDVANALLEVARKLGSAETHLRLEASARIKDDNGNKVGEWEVTSE